MNTNIYFANAVQKTLFDCELVGQLSDGYWENSRPSNHWKLPCSANLHVCKEGEVPHVDFSPDRRYRFDAPDLLKYVGDRMLTYAKLRLKYPNVSDSAIRNIESVGKYKFEGEYAQHCAAHFAEFGVKSIEEQRQILQNLHVQYEMSHLKKDLKAIKEAFNRVIYKPYSPVDS
jgi:hypothetical protein